MRIDTKISGLLGWWNGGRAEMEMLDKTQQSDRAPNPDAKPESCYCSALPKGSDLCLPCYTRWLGQQTLEEDLRMESIACGQRIRAQAGGA
jgi:hypothetical protein